jgi:Asp-tRNA(Asn)/Glu-tRNA(Gln) amidotransferase A subunit family amidase
MIDSYSSFSASRPRFADGSDTPRDYLERCLAALEQREPDIRAFVCMDIVGARALADQSSLRYRNKQALSLLDGCPLAVKDIIETADFPTQMNSRIFEGWQPNRDAACVYALRRGGAIVLGKTVTTEFATAASGPTRNPHDLTRTPGGSSSGSAAAVAAGMVPLALGTQTAGSILRPAAYCGIYGFKPSHAALNIGGVHPLSNSHDTLGTLAASLADAWLAARYIAEQVGGTPPHPGLSGPDVLPDAKKPETLVVLRTDAWPSVDAQCIAAFDTALDALRTSGVTLVDKDNDADVAALEDLLHGVDQVAQTISIFERRWPFLEYLHRYPDHLSGGAAERARRSAQISRDEYLRALGRQTAIRQSIDGLRSRADGFISLTAAGPAPPGLAHTGDRSLQIFWTMTGAPSITLPRLKVAALPLGVQVMGFQDADAALAATAHWIDHLLQSRESAQEGKRVTSPD